MEDSAVVSRIVHESYERAAPLMPEGHWWEHLDENFARTPEKFDLARSDRMQIGAAAAFDHAVRAVFGTMVGATAIPFGFNPMELRRSMQNVGLYAEMAESGDPTRFFHEPPSGVRVRVKPGRWRPRFEPDDAVREVLQFDSPFQPVHADQHKRYLRHDRNRVAYARMIRHRDGPRPTIAAIHGFTAEGYLINEWFFALPWFYRMGCDIVLFTLPFHGPRQTRFSAFSGHGFFAGGTSRFNEAVAQSVFDFRILLDWLQRERGVEQLGVTGLSLGGFVSSMLASVENRLAFALPNVPIISVADLIMEWQPVGTLMRAALAASKLGPPDARRLVAVSCPLTYPPVLPRERLMIVGGAGDRLAPPKHSRLLWDHWQRCRMYWFPGSHSIHLDRGKYLTEMARFMMGIGFLPEGSAL